MEALVYDDFSGDGPLEARNTSYKASQRWARGQPDRTYYGGLILANGEAIDPRTHGGTDGYFLVEGIENKPVELRHPFTIVVESFLDYLPGESDGTVIVCLGHLETSEVSGPFMNFGSQIGSNYPRFRVGDSYAIPNSGITFSGYLDPGATIRGYNRFVVSVNEFGMVAPDVNGQKYGMLDSVYNVPAISNLAIVVRGRTSIRSITVYDGYLIDPPTTPPAPPTPPGVATHWWRNEKNATLEPL